MKLVYPGPTGGVAVMAVAPKYETDMSAAGKKLLPKGVPFKIIEESVLPADDTFFDAWEMDFSNPDGLGERE